MGHDSMPKFCTAYRFASREGRECGMPATHVVQFPTGALLFRCEVHLLGLIAIANTPVVVTSMPVYNALQAAETGEVESDTTI